MKIKLYEILINNADTIVGNDPKPGHNGPYNDVETIVRIYSHWTILLIKAFQISGENKYRDRAIEFINFLFTKEARPYEFTFHHRISETKDKCNGLIGQAWTIEALMFAYKVLEDIKCKELAEDVFLLHKFNKTLGLWKIREINGDKLWFDMTFNHQLWFAMAGALIPNDIISKQINRFMKSLTTNLHTYSNGLIKHFIYATFSTPIYLTKNKLNNININKKYLYEKEIGYHAFNCYALSILKENHPKNQFWGSRKFKKIVEFIISDEHFLISEKNKYGFSFNPSGIETAFFVYTFRDMLNGYEEIMKERLESQFKKNLDPNTSLLINNTDDMNNLSARIYEIVRLPNIDLDI